MTITTDRANSGEIPRVTDPDAETQNLGRYLIGTPSFEAIPRRVVELDDTVTYLPATIGVVPDLDGPQAPPPPLPPIPDEATPATERLTLLGSLGADLPPFPVGYVGRHRHPEDLVAESGALPMWGDLARTAEPVVEARVVSSWAAVAITVGVGLALYASMFLAVVAVVR